MSNVTTILSSSKAILETYALAQGAYALDADGQPVAGKAGALGEGLTALDLLGALHRAAYEEGLLEHEEAARSAISSYLGYPRREDTSGTILRDWNDVPGRDAAAVIDLIDTVLATL